MNILPGFMVAGDSCTNGGPIGDFLIVILASKDICWLKSRGRFGLEAALLKLNIPSPLSDMLCSMARLGIGRANCWSNTRWA